jgi:hypothetical protein
VSRFSDAKYRKVVQDAQTLLGDLDDEIQPDKSRVVAWRCCSRSSDRRYSCLSANSITRIWHTKNPRLSRGFLVSPLDWPRTAGDI